jgi:hypothetical protein
MRLLASARPVFHSEADFQHELAWLIHSLYPTATIRLERPVKIAGAGRPKLDLWVVVDGVVEAIELKYQTVALSTTVNGEEFSLANKGAEDNLGYDFLKDLVRVEHLAMTVPGCIGHAILLSNEAIWNQSLRSGEFNKDAFRMHEGRELAGTLSWREPDRAKERAAAHALCGTYRTTWTDYSEIGGTSGRFRYLWLCADPSGWPAADQPTTSAS